MLEALESWDICIQELHRGRRPSPGEKRVLCPVKLEELSHLRPVTSDMELQDFEFIIQTPFRNLLGNFIHTWSIVPNAVLFGDL